MSQLFPTIYLSFDGFQRRQLKQELHRAFNHSSLSRLGFKLKLSPRTIIDFGTPDPQVAAEQCKQSALFVALLEDAAGHGSRQQMLHTELSHAAEEAGTQTLMLSEMEVPELPDAMTRLLNQHRLTVEPLPSGELAQAILSQIEALVATQSASASLKYLPDDFSVQGVQPGSESESEILSLLLQSEALPPAASQALANLQQHHAWLLDNLVLNNAKGAEHSVQQCLSLFDGDLKANYWRCRLLVGKATKEAEWRELIERASIVQRHLAQKALHCEELQSECHYYQAQGYIGLGDLSQACLQLEQSQEHQYSVSALYQLALCTMQQLAQQESPPERHDPSLLTAKQACLDLLKCNLAGYQLATQQLLMKTPREKLDMMLLGVQQEVICSVRQLLAQEQKLKQQCADWELIITPQVTTESQLDLLAKPVWNLVVIGRESIQRQLTLLQLLARQVQEAQQQKEALEQERAQVVLAQKELSEAMTRQEFKYKNTCQSKVFAWWGLSFTLLMAALLISGFWWLPVANTALANLLGADLIAIGLLTLLLNKQAKRLAQIKLSCRALDQEYALDEDELPEPRAQEGWFDRLAVRRDKLRDKQLQLSEKLKHCTAQLGQRTPQLAQAQLDFEQQSLTNLNGTFNPWQPNLPGAELTTLPNSEQVYALPPELEQFPCDLPSPPAYILLGARQAAPWACYFQLAPDPAHCKELHLLQRAANTEEVEEPEPEQERVAVEVEEQPGTVERAALAQEEGIDSERISLLLTEAPDLIPEDAVTEVPERN